MIVSESIRSKDTVFINPAMKMATGKIIGKRAYTLDTSTKVNVPDDATIIRNAIRSEGNVVSVNLIVNSDTGFNTTGSTGIILGTIRDIPVPAAVIRGVCIAGYNEFTLSDFAAFTFGTDGVLSFRQAASHRTVAISFAYVAA